MPAADKNDPIAGFQFAVEVPQIQLTAMITEANGFDWEQEVIETKVTKKDGHDAVIKSPGRLKWAELTLKRPATSEMSFFNWRKMVEDGKITEARCNGSIIIYDYDFAEVARWNFVDAWPSKYSMSGLNASNSEATTETLTIQHHGIQRAK